MNREIERLKAALEEIAFESDDAVEMRHVARKALDPDDPAHAACHCQGPLDRCCSPIHNRRPVRS